VTIVRTFSPKHSESGYEINPVERVGFVAMGQIQICALQQMSSYSITSSAMASSVAGISRPIAF